MILRLFPRASKESQKYVRVFNRYSDCRVGVMGYDYNGRVNVTRHGTDCIPWEESPEPIPDAGNLCRNPKRRTYGPYCYTKNATDGFEYCAIPKCRKCMIMVMFT